MSRLTVITPNKERSTAERLLKEFEQRIIASPPGVCPVDLQLSFLKVCHAQTCGKCVPCRVGLGQLENLMEDVLDGKATMKTMDLMKNTARNIQISADCAIGYEAARMVLTGLDGFHEDYVSHIKYKKCTGAFEQPIPCIALCPATVDIPGYIALIGEARYEDAVKLIRKDNPFPTACALICEHPCEARCRRNMIDNEVNIRGLKRFAVDNANSDKVAVPENAPSTNRRVAIVGGGPSGLTAAYFLQLMGHQTTVFEEKQKLGGMLRYGIPNYRFPRERLDEDINGILATGVDVHCNCNIGTDITMEMLRKDYDAIYVAIGAHTDKNFGIEGAQSKGVVSAVQLLREIGYGNIPDFSGQKIVVIGGGNVAMDCARSAIRSKADKVSIVYRRRQKDMTALASEVEAAIAESVELLTLQAPLRVETDKDGNTSALWVQPQISGTYDKAGRPRPVRADRKEVRIECDMIIVAIGQEICSQHFEEFGMPAKYNCLVAQDTGAVKDLDGIFAGGDCVSGPATVIKAIAAGKAAAANIDNYLGFDHKISCDVEIPQPNLNNKLPSGRIHLIEREACERKHDFLGIEYNMSLEEAVQESGRCLRCDHFGCGVLRGGREEKW
ncbi:FAD-dependent oxidoreductase [Lachnospiraceae bacterium ZAX-1]